MITERQIKKLMEEHIKNMDSSFEAEKVAAKENFLAGAIAILKLLNSNDFRFMNQIKHDESK